MREEENESEEEAMEEDYGSGEIRGFSKISGEIGGFSKIDKREELRCREKRTKLDEDRKSTRLNSSHERRSRMPSSA